MLRWSVTWLAAFIRHRANLQAAICRKVQGRHPVPVLWWWIANDILYVMWHGIDQSVCHIIPHSNACMANFNTSHTKCSLVPRPSHERSRRSGQFGDVMITSLPPQFYKPWQKWWQIHHHYITNSTRPSRVFLHALKNMGRHGYKANTKCTHIVHLQVTNHVRYVVMATQMYTHCSPSIH